MANNDLTIDVGYCLLNHFGEELCGDHIEQTFIPNTDTYAVVLADGLGSGVKANILSILTSKIISSMIASGSSIDDCVKIIANTLPICKVRGVAYSTFSIVKVIENKIIEVYEYDNPHFVFLRNGKHIELDYEELMIENKKILKTTFPMKENDVLILFSDGAIHAGIGATLNFGWERENIAKYMESSYVDIYSAKTISNILSEKCNYLYNFHPGDDTTALVVKVRKRVNANFMIGPAANKEDDLSMCLRFINAKGLHIVSGGTTSNVISKYLDKEIYVDINQYVNSNCPPMATIEGIDLVTEGVITYSKILDYVSDFVSGNDIYGDWLTGKDGASKITRILLEQASDITFYVGTAINPAHQNPALPITFNIKMQIIEKLTAKLKEIGKKVTILYF